MYSYIDENVVTVDRCITIIHIISLSHCSPDELATMKEIFKRLLVEQNIKVFGVFLDVLVLFLPRHGRRVKDWVFVMVLRLLHRQSSELPETVLCKIQSVFERIR